MLLKDWNALDESVRVKIAKVVFALDDELKCLEMAKPWHHNLDDEHRNLIKAVTAKDDGTFVVKVTV